MIVFKYLIFIYKKSFCKVIVYIVVFLSSNDKIVSILYSYNFGCLHFYFCLHHTILLWGLRIYCRHFKL